MFAQKLLRVTFQLAQGTFTGTSANSLTVTGLRTTARVNKAGALAGCKLDLAIYGMTLSQMNDLSTLGMQIFPTQISPNLVTIEASSDAGKSWSTVFSGAVQSAFGDLTGMPNAVLRVLANSTGAVNVIGSGVTSSQGTVSAVVLLTSLAQQGGLTLENNNVGYVPIRNPYYYGSVNDRIKAICEDAGLGSAVDDGVLAIWPRGASRGNASNVPLISSATGLVGFPSYTASGLLLKTLYNPAIVFQSLVQVSSRVISALPATRAAAAGIPINGIWAVGELNHDLESIVPGGSWFSELYMYNPAFPQPVVQ